MCQGTELEALHGIFLVLTITLKGSYYDSHCTDRERATQR
jgi:hypothetical protein